METWSWSWLLFLAVGSAGVLLLAHRSRSDSTLPTAVALLATTVFAIVVYQKVGLYAPDSVRYDQIANELAIQWQGGPEPSTTVGAGKEGYPIILALLYTAFGHQPQLGIALGVIARALVVVIGSLLALQLGLPAKATSWLLALFPPILIWSVFLLRESLTWALILLAILATVHLTRAQKSAPFAVLLLVSMSGLLWIRGSAAVLVGFALICLLTLGLMRAAERRSSALGIVLILLALAPRVMVILERYTPQSVETSRVALQTADSSFSNADQGPSSIVERLAHVTLGPPPWEWGSVQYFFVVDGLLWVFILVFSLVAILSMRKRSNLFLFAPAALILASLAVTSANYGTMGRLRVQVAVMLIPLAAMGIDVAIQRCRRYRNESHLLAGR